MVRPEGWVTVQNVDWIAWTYEPAPSLVRAARCARQRVEAPGWTPFIGRRMPRAAPRRRPIDVAVDTHARIWRSVPALEASVA